MFKRYTEKARRVIFYARYEASQFGSPYIETEHLLLGIMRESRDLLLLFGDKLFPAEQIRKQIEDLQVVRAKIGSSVDLPLSNEGKRALAYAAEEAERLKHKHIGTEHLFLGLLREQNCVAAKLLNERGVTLWEARNKVTGHVDKEGVHSPGVEKIHGAVWPAAYLSSRVSPYKNFAWQKQARKARDILVEKQGGRVMFYTGQAFDESRYELKRGGWTLDLCAVCEWQLYESDDPEHGIGYTNGRDWVCTECYEKFFAPPVTPLDDLYT